MNPTPRQTAAQAILRAAATLPATFSDAQLVVASWQADPDRFGLRGFERQYPHSNKVIAELCGKKKLNPVRLGYLERIRPNTFRLTDLGREQLDRIQNGHTCGDYADARGLLSHPDFLRWRATQERPAAVQIPHLTLLTALFRRYAGKYLTPGPHTPKPRVPITPDEIGEGLAFLEVVSRPRKRSA